MLESESSAKPARSESSGSGSKVLIIAIAGIYVLASLYVMFDLQARVASLETGQKTLTTAQEGVKQEIASARTDLRAETEAIAEKVGVTQQELEARTETLKRQQRAAVSRLMKQQEEQITAVTGEVEEVRTAVGGVRTDVDANRSDLVATRDKLDRTVGDLGVQSGLIARTREELEILRRRGEKNYHEFALAKGQPVQVADISLQLKKSDPKRSKFTVDVIADDRRIEKKDRTMLEPMQFYTGKDRKLYEVVVFGVDKNKVTGYLATPKELIAQAQ
jgi:chromosome segregation ATPase